MFLLIKFWIPVVQYDASYIMYLVTIIPEFNDIICFKFNLGFPEVN